MCMHRILNLLWSKEAGNDAPQHFPCQPEEGSCKCIASHRDKKPCIG